MSSKVPHSYKNQTIVEPFSPKHNVIVGRNGSGKSNFFAAIRFVLSDAYTQLGREERSALLHEGSGSVMSAYVEIIFDNSDDRFPTGKDELVLRRTIGQKKDEYTLDRKNATKADVMNLLETAGFSRSNPYYIVPQGRVTRLTNMKDAERLDLLKSVAGTGVYDQRKEESQKIMNETNNKLASIDVTFDQIRERLSELEEEQQELRSFQEKDQERRGLQYNLFHREQEMLSQALSDIEEKRETGIEDADEHRMRAATCDEELATINEKMAELKQQIEFARVDRKALEDERREAAKAQAQVELEVKNMTDGQSAAQKAKHTHDAELQRVRTTLKQRETELGQIMPKYNKLKQAEEATKAKLDEAQTARQRLYAKQGRSAAYKTKKDRDTWLDGQINDTYQHLSTMKAVRVQTAEEVKEVEIEVKDLEPEIQKLQDQIDGHRTSLEEINQQILKEKEDRDNLMDQRKELWREEAKLDSTVSTSRTDLDRAERNLSHMMDGNTFRGIQSVRRIAEKHNLDGCYGTLAELIEVPTHKTAVEVTAGNSLFHYVVDNDDTATRVMEILNKERAGRVTFMPLNRLKPKVPKFPNAQDARPLMSLIQFDEKYEKAVQQVFGKSIICQNLTVAGQYARTHGVNAVTPEGDRSDKKGALTGGYHDPRSSRLAATKALVDARQAFDTARARGTELRRKLDKLDQTITGKVGEIQKLEQRKNHAQNQYGLLRQELKTKVDLLRNKKESLDAKQRQEAELAAKVKALSDQQNAYEAEKATEFKKALTATEESQLENLAKTVKDLQQQYSKVASERSEVETRKALIEVELKDNLQPMLEQLEASELENAESGGSADMKALQLQLKRHNKTLQTLKQKLSASEEQIETWTTNVASLEAQSAEMRKEQEELTKQIERHQRRLEKSMQKKAALQNRRQETIESIRELGAVSDDAKKRFEKWNSEKIVKQLHKVNEALKKYTSVNKHAFEHYRKSTKQREALEERRKELEDSKKSIEELIEVLDQRKDEAIERTFRQVSREFTNVFAKLVPAGKGRLIIQRKADKSNQNGEEVDSDEEQARRSSVENYIGVGISVSFNSKHDDQQRIQQLSGGQKSKSLLYSMTTYANSCRFMRSNTDLRNSSM
jgi:structural maintenance of chromosome 3 (chondroitin sulfate proteoglycan 6)